MLTAGVVTDQSYCVTDQYVSTYCVHEYVQLETLSIYYREMVIIHFIYNCITMTTRKYLTSNVPQP